MTTLTDTQVITASGGLVELGYTEITSAVTVTSTIGQNVGGSVTAVCDGSPVVVEMFCPYTVVGGLYLVSSLYVDGSFQQRTSVQVSGTQPMYAKVRLTPSAGTHTFQWSALVNTSSATFQFDTAPTTNGGPGFLRVSKIVQATQWPAVTTGTIICTSSTRPSAPFEGQTIYETDTDLSLTWSGSAWVQTGSLGAWTTFVPTLTQSGTVTKTDSYCKWTRFGRTIHATAFVSATGFGMANNPVDLSLPVLAAAGAGTRIGVGHVYDASISTRYTGVAEVRVGSNSVGFVGDWSGNTYWGQAPLTGVAPSDQIAYSVTYEAAS